MVKLIDLFNKLKSDYEERQRKINKVLDDTSKAMEAHAEGMINMGEAMNTIEKSINELKTNYEAMKKNMNEELNNLKNNYWLKLFGVK